MAKKTKRAESRARYFTRKVAGEKGWNLSHPEKGGDFLEEQEISDYFPKIGLGLKKPDFLVCLKGEPVIVIETKNEIKKYKDSINEAIEYCEIINKSRIYNIKIAIGVAGEEEHGFIVIVKFLNDGVWVDLKSGGNPLTAIISKTECINALKSDNGNTELTIPSQAEFIEAAIEISNILRTAKIETTLRPKVVGTITAALYKEEVDFTKDDILFEINKNFKDVINQSEHFSEEKRAMLIEALVLGNNDFNRLSPYVLRIINILKSLNIKAVLQSDFDFLGTFYEAFLRYGADNNAMGIVFTPRHITKLCVDLIGVELGHKVIDLTCGTGGFLVAAFDKLKNQSHSDESYKLIRESIYGFDTNPTVWALSCLNMFFRGDGRSHIEQESSLNEDSRNNVKSQFHRAFLNPPFHQEGEPERDFINASMDALIEGGLFAGVVYAGVFADDDNAIWREEFFRKHTLLAMISLPDDLFYPNASAITTIMIAKAKIPQPKNSEIFMARIINDGFEKLKGKRIECKGNQIPQIVKLYHDFVSGKKINEEYAMTISSDIVGKGSEYSPQKYLKQGAITNKFMHQLNSETLMSLFKAVTSYPDITYSLKNKFPEIDSKDSLPYNEEKELSYFFDVVTGKSSGLKGYSSGIIPYVSSGDDTNGIVGLVLENTTEICDGCITVSAFGKAYLQPWRYMARGNGGSAVRILKPRFDMTIRELFWFVGQINSQKWRFTYARQAIKSRLKELVIKSPPHKITKELNIPKRIEDFKVELSRLSEI